jgi:hypothetical protein
MATQVYVKAILPKLYPKTANAVKANLRAATKRVCDRAAEELRFLVEPWDHQPQPTVKIEETANEIKGTAQTEDKAMFMLDGGTSERWALMSNPFEAKTSHKSLRSGLGVGGAVIRGRSAMTRAGLGAQPGIDAQEFSVALKEKYAPEFEREIDKVMADAIAKGQAVKP